MSRTHKDKPWKLRQPESKWDFAMERVPYQKWSNEFQYWYNFWCYIERPGVKTKKKRSYKQYHGMPTPMWYVHEFMTVPQRAAGRQWEKKIVKVPIGRLIDEDIPSVSRKPHWYYW
jgi:hypothetical protein